MVIMLIAPFIIFGQMADRKQAESTRHNTTVSSEVKGEEAVEKPGDSKMQFTWKTVLILSVGVLAAVLRFRRMRQLREKDWDARGR